MSRPKISVWTLPQPQNSPLGSQKVKNDPKFKSNQMWDLQENESCITTWVDLVVEPYSTPKNCPWGPQKVKNDPKITSKSNTRIERNTENESCSNTWVDPKTVVEPYPNPKK